MGSTDMEVVELQFVHVIVNLEVLIIEHTEHRIATYVLWNNSFWNIFYYVRVHNSSSFFFCGGLSSRISIKS